MTQPGFVAFRRYDNRVYKPRRGFISTRPDQYGNPVPAYTLHPTAAG